MAEQMEKYEEVYWKTIEYAKETAREAGLKEGQVLAFLKMNLPITEIMKHTGLSEEEIQKIKALCQIVLMKNFRKGLSN